MRIRNESSSRMCKRHNVYVYQQPPPPKKTNNQLLAAHPAAAVPLSLLLGYGVARTTATAFQELRSAVFATVAQKAIRKVRSCIIAVVGW